MKSICLCDSWALYRFLWTPAPYGLPQGSVFGPLLYIIYTSDLASLLASYAVLAQLYADDVQAQEFSTSEWNDFDSGLPALPRLRRRRDRPGYEHSLEGFGDLDVVQSAPS